MSKKPHKIDDKEKVILPDNIVALIAEIVKDINQIKTVVDDIHTGNYPKAVSDLLQVVENIVTDLILPKVLKQSAQQGHQAE